LVELLAEHAVELEINYASSAGWDGRSSKVSWDFRCFTALQFGDPELKLVSILQYTGSLLLPSRKITVLDS
jgi:hypothetical protein